MRCNMKFDRASLMLTLTVWILLQLWTVTCSEHQLRMVHVLFRHGDRSPIRAYTNDIYKESDWPQGFGQLSQTGMLQEYELGKFFRHRYVDTGFMSENYTRVEMTVRSTDIDRTLMSAASMLTGLYPARTNLPPTEPIPIHTVPGDVEKLMSVNIQCPESIKDKSALGKHKEETLAKYKDFYEYVSNYSGEPNSFEGVGNVLDPLFCQRMNNYTLPDWMNDTLFRQVVELRDHYASQSAACAPGLVKALVDHMANKTSKQNSMSQKMFVYSGHDSTVCGLLNSLQVFNNRQPPYTACVLIELYEHPPGQFSVQVSYRNESQHEPYIFILPGCSEFCPLDRFTTLLKPILELASSETPNISAATVVASILGAVLFIVLLILGVVCHKYRKYSKDHHDYSPVPLEMT